MPRMAEGPLVRGDRRWARLLLLVDDDVRVGPAVGGHPLHDLRQRLAVARDHEGVRAVGGGPDDGDFLGEVVYGAYGDHPHGARTGGRFRVGFVVPLVDDEDTRAGTGRADAV